jgi:hypothetical protein
MHAGLAGVHDLRTFPCCTFGAGIVVCNAVPFWLPISPTWAATLPARFVVQYRSMGTIATHFPLLVLLVCVWRSCCCRCSISSNPSPAPGSIYGIEAGDTAVLLVLVSSFKLKGSNSY